MKEKRRQTRRFSLSRLVFAVLFFSSLLSVYTAARYVLTRHVAFAIAVDKSLLQGYVEEGLVWDLHEGNTALALNHEGYTITLMADGTEGIFSGGTALETQIGADSIFHRTGYATAEGAAVETVVPCSAYYDKGHALTAAIVANTEKGELYTYLDNHLVQVYTLGDDAISELEQLTAFSGENLRSARIYNRILTQAELSQNYYMDLLNYGDYEAQELPEFIQKSSLLRVESLYDWEDAGARNGTKTEAGSLSIENSIYRGIKVATASEASLNYELNQEDKTTNGYTLRYIISVNSGGTAEELFTSGGEAPDIKAAIQDMEFVYSFAGKDGSVFCGNEGKTVIDLTVNEQGQLSVYKNTECIDTFSDAETGMLSTKSFSIRPSAYMDTDGELGALYKVEVYDRALSPVELQYLFLRDEEAFHIGFREPLSFEVMLPEEELIEGDWITFGTEELIPWPEEEEYEFSHWFCKEYNVELYDEDLIALSAAMEADGFYQVHIKPIYIQMEELMPEATPSDAEPGIIETPVNEETVPEETGDTMAESQPAESQPAESQPAESQPVESIPEASQPTESVPAESQPTETVPEESQPEESTPMETVPEASPPTESVPVESQPTESVPEESQPVESQPTETMPEETLPTEDEAVETSPIESAPEESLPESAEAVSEEMTIE